MMCLEIVIGFSLSFHYLANNWTSDWIIENGRYNLAHKLQIFTGKTLNNINLCQMGEFRNISLFEFLYKFVGLLL